MPLATNKSPTNPDPGKYWSIFYHNRLVEFFKNLIKSYNMESLLDGFFHLACFEIFCVVGFMSSLFFLLLKSYIVWLCQRKFSFLSLKKIRTWKQPRCPSADEWIRKMWYIYTMEYYSAIKKNTFESVLMRWMKLEPIRQSKGSQKEKHQYSILTHIYGI